MVGCKTCGGNKIRAYLNKQPLAGFASPKNVNNSNQQLLEDNKKVIYKRVNGRLVTEVIEEVIEE